MTRLNLFLLILLVLCALGVVTSQHKSRKIFTDLEREQTLTRKLDIEWGQLQLEQSTWAMHSRLEQEAGDRLKMRLPDARHTIIVAPSHTVESSK